jgi:hypothetical protein
MTNQELDALAARANSVMMTGEYGHSSCTVASYDPPILAYHCADNQTAELFKAKFEMLDTKFKHVIHPSNLTTVLQYR